MQFQISVEKHYAWWILLLNCKAFLFQACAEYYPSTILLHFSLPFPILFPFNYRLNVSSLLKLQSPQRNSLIYNELLMGDLLA